MSDKQYGRIIDSDEATISASYEKLADQAVDHVVEAKPDEPVERFQTTLAAPFSVAGPGTYRGKATRTLNFEPSEEEGWWFDRVDLPDSLPVRVAVCNIWTTARNLVLCSGSPHNYMRMVEHIIALRLGMGLDNVVIRIDSGDPPLFDRSSMDLVEAVEKAGIETQKTPIKYMTVKEPVTVGGSNGSFLTFLPCEKGSRPMLSLDCSVHFADAIGQQRIQFDVTRETFRNGAFARTNCPQGMYVFYKTLGLLFADMRNMGYTDRNILICGKEEYVNEPRMLHEGKSLEAAWHRATLDLLAAIALIEHGRFVGKVISYKSGHALDVIAAKRLYQNKLLVPFEA